MVGGILQMYAYNLLENNIENVLNAYSSGGIAKLDLGMLGKGIERISKGKIKTDAVLGNFAKVASNKTLKGMAFKTVASGLSKFFFNPYVIAGRIAVGSAWDNKKEKKDLEFDRGLFSNIPDNSNNYRIDETYNMLSANSFDDMERVRYTVNQLLSDENIATNMIDRAFRNL